MKSKTINQENKPSAAEQIAAKIEAAVKALSERLYNEEMEPTAANFRSLAEDASRILASWTNGAPGIACKRDYVEWIAPFMNLIKNIEGVDDPDDPLCISIIHTEYAYGSPEYDDINAAMEALIPHVKILMTGLNIGNPDELENLDEWWGAQVASDGRGMRKIFFGGALRHYLNAIGVELPRAFARARDDNNIFIYNNPSLKGTGIYSNINIQGNGNIQGKRKIPKKGGGKWQTGQGKKMIDYFLDWHQKDCTALKSKTIAKKVWEHRLFKEFVDKLIDHSKGPLASDYTFINSFYPACIRALNCKNAE